MKMSSKRKDPYFIFFEHFGDPSAETPSIFPTTTYPDVPIDPLREIRLVELLPAPFEDEINCRLITIPLTGSNFGNRPFIALSYTWGGFTNPASITINGQAGFTISRNLWCGLKRIRKKDTSQYIWIDQICINQEDIEERSIQVSLMGKVYVQAESILIWLGDNLPGEKDNDAGKRKALAMVIELACHGRKNMSLCWWKRLWVLQEFSLARNEPRVQFGTHQMFWHELCELATKYNASVYRLLPDANNFAMLAGLNENFAGMRDQDNAEKSLRSYWWVFPQLGCGNPRDKIYGLLGLLPHYLTNAIKVDYKKSEVQVFCEATFAELRGTKSLSFLSLVRRKPITKGLPSWAVDFVWPEQLENQLALTMIGGWQEQFNAPTKAWLQRSPTLSCQPKIDSTFTCLTISALSFDDIILCMSVDEIDSQDGHKVTSANKLTMACATPSLFFDKQERKFLDAVLKPLDAKSAYERLQHGLTAFQHLPTLSSGHIRRFLAEVIIVEWLGHEIHDKHECINQEVEEVGSWPLDYVTYADCSEGDLEKYASDDTYRLSSSFFVTKTGFVGVGPACMRSTDVIVLPHGSRYPMLLRAGVDDTWTFISFVHVTGIMNHQLWEICPDLKLPERQYELR